MTHATAVARNAIRTATKARRIGSPRFDFTIDRVSPDVPGENGPVRVWFSLTNKLGPTTSGLVWGNGGTPETKVRVENLVRGATFSGDITVAAPLAGENVELDIYYTEDSPAEFHPPDAVAATILDVAATYYVSVDTVHVGDTRAGIEENEKDNVYVSGAARVGDAQPLTNGTYLGKLGSGTYPARLHLGTFVQVPGKAPDLNFSYLVTNGGGSIEPDVLRESLDDISQATKYILDFVYSDYTSIWGLADWVTQWLNSWLFPNCDGPVAADKVVLTSIQLDQLTLPGGIYRETRNYPGLPSPAMCGGTSNYDVTWMVYRFSLLNISS